MRRRICGSILSLIDTAKTDRLEGRRLRFEAECFVERGEARLRFGCAVHVELHCWSFLGYAMIFNEVKYLTDGGEIGGGCEVSRRAPDAQRDGGKTRFFPQRGDFRTEIAILFYI